MALKNIAIIVLIVFIASAVHAATDDKTTDSKLETTEETSVKPVKVNGTEPENLTESSSEESSIVQTSEVSPTSSQSSSTHRKNILYDQRQEGNLNVRLDLENITVIFVPAKKNTQLSLIDLLMKSSQLLQNKQTGKQKGSLKKKAQHEYLQYKNDEPAHDYKQLQNQFIESRSPYKVEISSTLNQGTVDITPNAQQNTDSSAMNFQPQFARSSSITRTNKRSIDDTLYATYYDQDRDLSNMNNKFSDYSKLINTLDRNVDDVSNESDTDLILIGATEQCGPGSRRDSYGVCQFVNL